MDLTIHLTPEMERELEQEAERLRISPAEAAERVLREHLVSARNAEARILLRQWREEGTAEDAEDVAAGQAEWEALKTALDEDRPSDRPLFPK